MIVELMILHYRPAGMSPLQKLGIFSVDAHQTEEKSWQLISMTLGHSLVDDQISAVFRHVGLLVG